MIQDKHTLKANRFHNQYILELSLPNRVVNTLNLFEKNDTSRSS